MGFNLELPHLAKGLNGIDIYKQGLELGDLWLERKKNAELAKIERDTQDIEDSGTRFEKMIGLAKQSKRSKWLIDDINAMQSAQAQAQLANQAKMADINKTMSETNKNNATATDTMAGVGNKRLSMLRPAHEILAQTGQTAQAMKYLDYARASGAIDDDTYKAVVDEWKTWADLSPDETKAVGMAYAKGTLSPEYLHQTVNNRADNETKLATNALDNQTKLQTNQLDNETSRLNNQNTVNAQMYGHNMDYQKAVEVAGMNNETERWKTQAGIDHENSLIDEHYKWQQEALKSGQAKVVEIDGRLALEVNGQYTPYVGKDGKPATPAPKAESRADKEARELKILDLEQSYDQMQQGMDLVDKVSGAFSAIGKGDGLIDNGWFKARSILPGTDEHALMGQIETLKSSVFLAQVSKMKGLGALTDTEGQKLETSIAKLDPYAKNFKESLAEIKNTFALAKERLSQRQAVLEQEDFNNAFY